MSLTSPPVLPTLYEYYTGNEIVEGLSDKHPYFTLNTKNITIYSGAFHYFRVPRAYWRDRLRKMRAAGLNTVETYVPWNLHEPHSGVYDFGSGGSDFEDFLHVEEFLKTAQEEDLFALVRPGPYICAEFEFGGLPSWILRNTTSVRNSKDKNYLNYVKRYFGVLLPLLALLQFQKGGPIIGFQIENEYGGTFNVDSEYLETIKSYLLDNGIIELLYTSDGLFLAGGRGSIPGILQTANFNTLPTLQLDYLKFIQPDKPVMTMEYWTGWYDYWAGNHTIGSDAVRYRSQLTEILNFPSSVNLYMFIGSTNFGFLNGANTIFMDPINAGLLPITTSYDYNSPISEYGGYTIKYNITKELIYERNIVKTKLPKEPEAPTLIAYKNIHAIGKIRLTHIIDKFPGKILSQNVVAMENLPINNNSGQSFGYIVYRKNNIDINPDAVLKIKGFVRDTVMVLINGNLVSPVPRKKSDLFGFGFWRKLESTLKLATEKITNATIDLVVENFGRNGYGFIDEFRQFKGLTNDILLDDQIITNWEIIPLEFKKSWLKSLDNKKNYNWSRVETNRNPCLYKFILDIKDEEPKDTFIDMRGWSKGVVAVNDFVIGRYFFLGPQLSLYLPGVFLVKGENSVVIFEHYETNQVLKFSDKPIFI